MSAVVRVEKFFPTGELYLKFGISLKNYGN